MGTNIISTSFEGKIITGEIIERQKIFLKVRITYPFVNWENYVGMVGPGQMDPNHYLTGYGD